jgi:group I intron endonuclease
VQNLTRSLCCDTILQIKEKDLAVVYWIRAPHHTDIFTEGYVGVTTQTAEKRFDKHVKDAKRGSELAVHQAIRKYGDKITVEVVIEGSEDYCYLMENKLRPEPHIGYNIAMGGNVSCTTGRKHTEESKRKMARCGEDHHAFGKKQPPEVVAKRSEMFKGEGNPMFGKTLTDEHKSKISKSLKGTKKPPESIANYVAAASGERSNNWGKFGYLSSICNVTLWCDAIAIYEAYHSVPKCGQQKLSTLLGKKYTKDNLEVICRMLKTGWNPSEDAKWWEFYHKHTKE